MCWINHADVCNSCAIPISLEYSNPAGDMLLQNTTTVDQYTYATCVHCALLLERGEEIPKMNVTEFKPYTHERKCAHKDCHNVWNELVETPPVILMCGGSAEVCSTCKNQGFSVYDGIGDGRFYLRKNGEEVSNYDLKTAYGLTEKECKGPLF